MHARKNAGHREGVRHVGLAAAAGLAVVRLFGVVVGATNLLCLLQRQVVADQLFK